MNIHYTYVEKNRLGDAPFLGTLIAGYTCKGNCKGCCNQHILGSTVYEEDSSVLINSIVDDPFSEGIILAGLEWSDQPEEMLCLIDEARSKSLEVILYTRHTEEYMRETFPELFKMSGLYIKFGEYDETKIVNDNIHYGVPLISSNQYILKIGE